MASGDESDFNVTMNSGPTPMQGFEVTTVPDIRKLLDTCCRGLRFNFVIMPLFPERDLAVIDEAVSEWSNYVVGAMARNMDLDSSNPVVRRNSELVFQQEMMWAAHLALSAIVIPTPSPFKSCANYARWVSHLLQSCNYLKPWVRLPLTFETDSDEEDNKPTTIEGRPASDPWEYWDLIRHMCELHSSLGIALELTANLPSEGELERWVAEPVRAIMVPTDVFISNRKGFPVLSKRHQAFVQRFARFKVDYIITAPTGTDPAPYKRYMSHLFSTITPLSEQEEFEAPYYDFLQVPLQPLMDNLESRTYEVFEKDPVKYVEYQRAVEKALIARGQDTAVIMVVGAGRGPLVRASLRAADETKKKVVVYAVEKNPNAVITLRHLHYGLQWGERVHIISSDMRVWQPPELADILVSELLGSFSDNELSPECLDGAQKLLKPDGISIPQKYISYLAPASTSKMWGDIKNSSTEMKALETLYVVRLNQFKQLAKSQPCFTFVHPTPQPADNNRYESLTFTCPESAVVHGFVGYFETQLYDDVWLSTNPGSYSQGMFSWFPAFFPISTPIHAKANEPITVSFWRQAGRGRVWYEWSLTSPQPTHIHNIKGRSYWIGV